MLRTKKQRETLCDSCPIARAADLVGDSLSLLILRDLLRGPKRFGELDASLCTSTRTLTKALRRLEGQKLIEHALPRGARQACYRLTKKGKALRGVINSLRNYGERYL